MIKRRQPTACPAWRPPSTGSRPAPWAGLALAAVLLAVLLWPAGQAPAEASGPMAFPPEVAQRLNACLQNALAEFKVPGVVAGVRDPQGRVWMGVAGWADLKQRVPMATNMHLRIGSVTKTYTANLILQLVDENKLGLDRPLSDYLDMPIAGGQRITIRHLLSMRSGLGNYSFSKAFAAAADAAPERDFTPEELVGYSNHTVGPPGAKYDYNNANFIILGLIIEKLTNSTFAEQVKQRILIPLHMPQTLAAGSCAMPRPFAHGYLFVDGAVKDSTCAMSSSLTWSAGNMVSTVADQLVWARAMADGRLLSAKSRTAQREFMETGQQPGLAYGLGLAKFHGGVGHSGNYGHIYTSVVMHFQGYDIAIMANGQGPGGDSRTSNATRIYASLLKALGF